MYPLTSIFPYLGGERRGQMMAIPVSYTEHIIASFSGSIIFYRQAYYCLTSTNWCLTTPVSVVQTLAIGLSNQLKTFVTLIVGS